VAAVARVPRAVIDRLASARAEMAAHGDVARALLASGVRPVRRGDPQYPSRLNVLANPPPLLYVRGRLPGDRRKAFGIVGTTQPSARGREVARTVARALARQGWVIVSGHARGIDAAAHRGALAARRPTVFVLPTGILQFHPWGGYPADDELWGRAAAVSEWHPHAPWQTPLALARNRVTAALSDCLLVVETGEEGGTMATLRHALALGRRAFVVRFRSPELAAAGNGRAEALGAEPVRSLGELERLLSRPRPSGARGELLW
jgi:DNA processing protein